MCFDFLSLTPLIYNEVSQASVGGVRGHRKYHEDFDEDVLVQRQRRHRGPAVLEGPVFEQQHGHGEVAVLRAQSDAPADGQTPAHTFTLQTSSEPERLWAELPDVHSDQVLAAGLLDPVAEGVAAHEGDVDVAPRDDV